MVKIIVKVTKERKKDTMDEERKLAQKKKLNMKLYPIYKIVASDVLFFNVVKVLFLTQVKGISNANVVFLETLYSFFKMIFTIPMSAIITKLGKRRSIIIGNIFWTLEFIVILFSKNYICLILSQFLSGIGWAFKSISETPFLTHTLPKTKIKGKILTKIDSNGYSKYCYINAITTIASGFLYEINPYIPLCLAIFFLLLSVTISLNFIEIEEKNELKTKTIIQTITEVKNDLKFIFKSSRLRSLILVLGFMWGIICLFAMYQSTLLKDINLPAKYIGIIVAILGIIQGKASTKANQLNEKYKNRTLTYIGLRITIAVIVAGGVVIVGISKIPQLAIIIFTCILRVSDHGMFNIIKEKYLGNFMSPDILTKVYSVNSLSASVFRMIISAIGSYFLTFMSIEYAMVVVGSLFTILTILVSKYIKTKIGLKPEEYSPQDIVCI
jgi:MFS family permease